MKAHFDGSRSSSGYCAKKMQFFHFFSQEKKEEKKERKKERRMGRKLG